MNLNKNPQNCILFCSFSQLFYYAAHVRLHLLDLKCFFSLMLILSWKIELFCEPIGHVKQQRIQKKHLDGMNIIKCVSTILDANLKQTLDKSLKESANQTCFHQLG